MPHCRRPICQSRSRIERDSGTGNCCRVCWPRLTKRGFFSDPCRASDYDKEKLQERVAKLTGGVALIKVGAATEMEMKEKKARVGAAAA